MANADDWRIDGIGDDGRLHHFVPTSPGLRVFFAACGLFVLGIATWELLPGVWPLTLPGLFFGVILVGAWSVGVPMLLAGLFAPTTRWTVSPQRIEIALDNPFRLWRVSLAPGAIASIDLRETESDSGPSTFRVVLRTVENRYYETRPYGSREAADKLRGEMVRIFYGETA